MANLSKIRLRGILHTIVDSYARDKINTLETTVSGKADKATTLEGYGITDGQQKLTNPLTRANIVNELTSTSTTDVLSASMGKALNDKATIYKNFDYSQSRDYSYFKIDNVVIVNVFVATYYNELPYTLFNLPAGYRPTSRIVRFDGDTEIIIETNGDVKLSISNGGIILESGSIYTNTTIMYTV